MQGSVEGHPHVMMRRKDREITDRKEIDAIIRSEKLMRIALVDGNMPFLVPVFYAFDGTALYFHSAQAGTKIEILKRNNNVCFEISVDHGIIESDAACDFEAKHRTVIGIGKAIFVENEAEKVKALDLVVAHFSAKKFEYPKANLNHTAVIRIDINSIKGKKHGF
jgi:nitroimidazol reductase NimA-like FMN-containing flavoprotein (pyridoxamine 5'-phosphate oxidase superfamily)